MAKAFTYVAAVYFGLVLLKNGSFTKLIADGAKGATDLANGFKSITSAA